MCKEGVQNMNRRRYILFALIVVLQGCGSPTKQQDSPSKDTSPSATKAALDGALAQYYQSADEAAFKRAASSYHYGTVRNNMTLIKRGLDKDFFDGFAKHDQLEFVTVVENGKTAALVFKDSGDDPPSFEATRFVWEDGGWKVDARGGWGSNQRTFDASMLKGDLAVDGVVKAAPPVTPMPDFAGNYSVQCTGYKVKLSVNGVVQAELGEGGWAGGVVKGGLKHGKNIISIAWTPDDFPTKELEVTITRCAEIGSADKSANELLHWKSKSVDGGSEDVTVELP